MSRATLSGCLECLILWRDALNSKHRAARPPTCWALPLRPGRQTAEDSLGARAALALAFRFGVGFGGGDGASLVLILSRERCLAQGADSTSDDSGTQPNHPVPCISLWCLTPSLEGLSAFSTQNTHPESMGHLFTQCKKPDKETQRYPAHLRMSLEGSISLCPETVLAFAGISASTWISN